VSGNAPNSSREALIETHLLPLAGLEAKGADVYLGAIHNMATLAARLAVARKFRPRQLTPAI
jgi:hypothetical protein